MSNMTIEELKRRLQTAVDLMNAERWEEAAALLGVLASLHPTNAYVLYNQGIIHWQFKRHAEAVQCYRRSLGADPRFLPTMVNLSNCLFSMGDFREALRYAQMSVHRQPGNAVLLVNLANVLAVLGEHKDAMEALRDALRIDPKSDKARMTLLGCLDELGHWEEAISQAETLVDHPDLAIRIPAIFAIAGIARRLSRWDLCDRYIPRLIADIGKSDAPALNPIAFAFFTDDPELMRRMALSHESPPVAATQRKPVIRDGRMTIAYLSPDFREHPVAQMLHCVLRNHDRNRVRLIAVSIIPMDDSKEAHAIKGSVDEVLDISQLDDTAAMHALHRTGVDILVDIAGTTKWHRSTLLARRPCPVQVLWLGCPCSTGARYYDGFILDDIVAPPGYDVYCAEPIIRLPGCYHPINEGIDFQPSSVSRADFGLPEHAHIVAMLQQPAKIRPPLVDRIAQVVARHSDAHFWIRVHQDACSTAIQRLSDLGLPKERIHITQRFIQRNDYLAAYRLADVIVDSYPYGGHSTTGEALMQVTPVLTFLGNCIHTRVAASMITEFGLGDTVRSSMEDMLGTLDQLLADRAVLDQWKHRFAMASKTYGNGGLKRLAIHLEDTFSQLLANKTN